MSCCLKKIRQKDCCLNSSATVGSDNSLTPLTSELAKLELFNQTNIIMDRKILITGTGIVSSLGNNTFSVEQMLE